MEPVPTLCSFDHHGGAVPAGPVILSVPHAGRDYPPELIAALAVPVERIVALEDRHVDQVALLARREEILFVQRLPRAWIDLNRAEHERDPLIDLGADAHRRPGRSARLRSGLGLVPRRASGNQPIWRAPFEASAIERRIGADHRPYHRAVAGALRAARARFGQAVLLDIHSMPPVDGPDPPAIVIGDRFGRSASAPITALVEAVVRAHGCRVGLNSPYAGGHILDVHGAPSRGIHAIQIEIDRSLYLDSALDQPGAGMAATAALLRAVIAALADDASRFAHAAE